MQYILYVVLCVVYHILCKWFSRILEGMSYWHATWQQNNVLLELKSQNPDLNPKNELEKGLKATWQSSIIKAHLPNTALKGVNA